MTGSSFADLVPYWSDRMGVAEVRGFQASKRGGDVKARQTLSSVRLTANTAVYLRGELDPAVGGEPRLAIAGPAKESLEIAVKATLEDEPFEIQVFELNAAPAKAERDVISVSDIGR